MMPELNFLASTQKHTYRCEHAPYKIHTCMHPSIHIYIHTYTRVNMYIYTPSYLYHANIGK